MKNEIINLGKMANYIYSIYSKVPFNMNSEPTRQKCVIEEMQTFSLISKKAYNGRISKVLQKVV